MFKQFSGNAIARIASAVGSSPFLSDQRGSMALSFMAVLFPMLMATGVAVDYGRAVGLRTSILSIADSASVAAARTLQSEYTKGLERNDGDDRAWAAAQRVALAEANTLLQGNQLQKEGTSLTSSVVLSRSGDRFQARVTAQAPSKSQFMQMFGFEQSSVAVESVAEAAVTSSEDKPSYADIYIMLDRTGSMLVGESPQDVAGTRARIQSDGQPCAFACHENSSSPSDPYNLIKSLNSGGGQQVRLKFDAAIDAIANFAGTAKPEYHRIAVYGIGHDWEAADKALVPLSSDLRSVASAVRGIRPEVTGRNYQTEISYSMKKVYNSVLSSLPKSGDGSSPSNRKIVLVLITDGVESIHHDVDWRWQDTGEPKWPYARGSLDRVTGAPYMMGYWTMSGSSIVRINKSGTKESVCKLVKDKVEIGIVEIEYPDLTGLDSKEYKYEKLVKYWQNRISSSLSRCASQSLYFKASQSRGAINDAAKALFGTIAYRRGVTVRLVR